MTFTIVIYEWRHFTLISLHQTSLKSIPPQSDDFADPVGGLAILKRSALSISPLRLSLKRSISTRKTYLRELNETTLEFPNLKDWTGTVRGMFMLYDTYEFNLTESTNGNIVFQVGWRLFFDVTPSKIDNGTFWLCVTSFRMMKSYSLWLKTFDTFLFVQKFLFQILYSISILWPCLATDFFRPTKAR